MLESAPLLGVSGSSEVARRDTIDSTLTSTLGTILNSRERKDANQGCKVAEKENTEGGPAARKADNSIATANQEMIADNSSSKSETRLPLLLNSLKRLMSSSFALQLLLCTVECIFWCTMMSIASCSIVS